MSSPPPEKKNLWDLAGARIGVIAAAVGLLVALLGLPHTIRNAFGGSSSSVSASDLAAKRARARAAGPRLEVRYLLLTSDLIQQYLGSTQDMKRAAAGTLAAAYPIVGNDVLSRIDSLASDPRSCHYQAYPNRSVAFLEISNRGRRDATNIVIGTDRLTLRGAVRVQEGASGGDDYVAKLRAAATASTSEPVRLPRTLGPGDGVRVPLFLSDAPTDGYDRWCALPGAVYLPRTLRFDDPALGAATTTGVRRMQTPLVIGRGAVERG
jgi:hypothetical protein